MGAMLTEGTRDRVAAGATPAQALSAATHAPWLLAVICGALVAAVGFATTSAPARAAAWSVAGPDDAA
jgi:hypothetical protein